MVDPPLKNYWVGQELNWDALSVPITLFVELPFWIMVPDCHIVVNCRNWSFEIDIQSGLYELYADEVHMSRNTCVYFGPNPDYCREDVKQYAKESNIATLPRKCKTALRIRTQCNEDALKAASEEGARGRVALLFLRALCEAHIEVINVLVRSYRLGTYDYFAHEISPWDVPVWFVEEPTPATVVLFDYARWDFKPVMVEADGSKEQLRFLDAEQLSSAQTTLPSPGELDLLDALNFMERGNYSDAVRRVTTSIESALEHALLQELLQRDTLPKATSNLKRTQNNFAQRLKDYQLLSSRALDAGLLGELDRTRKLRHKIVHASFRISFGDRGTAQRSVDTGRWIFNWIENDRRRSQVREGMIAQRALGRHMSLFNAEITAEGARVIKPK